jgi:mono/diheme cytochrome c family protein
MKRLKIIGKWLSCTILFLLLLITLAYSFIYIRTEERINRNYSFTEPELAIPADSLSIEKGAHLYQIRSCIDCHGANLEGGVFKDEAMLLQLTAPNITMGEGGLPEDFSIQDWVRVLRHGVDKNGKSLWLMPAHESTLLSKEDLANLIAYCQSVPPVDNTPKQLKKMGPIGRIIMMLDEIVILPAERIDHQAAIATTKPVEGIAYGQYLSTSCQGCHRPNLKGGGPAAPGFPPVPDITATGATGKWSEEQFINTLRNGKTPEGKLLRNEFMPWENIKHFSDEELMAIKSYLLSLK